MKTRSIEVLVHSNGELQIDAVGFSGPDCEKATAFLEAALGEGFNRRRKPEYYRKTRQQTMQRAGA